jgi:hypothetical protein
MVYSFISAQPANRGGQIHQNFIRGQANLFQLTGESQEQD